MFTRYLSLLLTTALVCSCSLKLDAPIAPNLQKVTADGNQTNADKGESQTPLAKSAAKKLLEKSIREKETNTKQYVYNITLSNALSAQFKIGMCLQIARFSDDTLVVDLADVTCPADGVLLSTNNIKYTALFYEVKKDTEYQITSANTKKVIGNISADWSFPMAQITELCSGSVVNNCKVGISYNSLVDITDL